ncbi:hypothetical protein OUZ56_028162 [Daphnia magna]|uniref:Uncharacterized protein n=1 Tax=Daphnia magna TaxID=35525 RepID=A0ABR0B3N3_9CRUS|nr:hypothetical protein OUZ56_028162 [Daphnia magna]
MIPFVYDKIYSPKILIFLSAFDGIVMKPWTAMTIGQDDVTFPRGGENGKNSMLSLVDDS